MELLFLLFEVDPLRILCILSSGAMVEWVWVCEGKGWEDSCVFVIPRWVWGSVLCEPEEWVDKK